MPPYKEMQHQPMPRVGDQLYLTNGVRLEVSALLPQPKGVLVGVVANGGIWSFRSTDMRLYRRLKEHWVWGLVASAEQEFLPKLKSA